MDEEIIELDGKVGEHKEGVEEKVLATKSYKKW